MKKIYLSFITLICLASCETIVELEVPQEPSRLVANGFINPDSTIAVRVSQSKHVLDNTDFQFLTVDQATILIFSNGTLIGNMTTTRDSLGGRGWYTSDIRPLPGNEYTLQIAAEGFETAETSAVIPPKVPIASLNFTTKQEEDGVNCDIDSCYTTYTTTYQFALTLPDPAGAENYYEVSAFTESVQLDEIRNSDGTLTGYDTVMSKYPVFLYSEDPATQDATFNIGEEGYYGESIVFRDRVFDGQSYVFRFNTGGLYSHHDKSLIDQQLHIQLKTIDRHRYQYFRSRQLQFDNEDNPFAEPINVYSNVINGYGVFGSFSTDTYTMATE